MPHDYDEEEDWEDEDYDAADLAAELLEHPRVRKTFSLLTETLDKFGQLIDRVAKTVPPTTSKIPVQPTKKLLNPFLVMGFNPNQPLTEKMIRERKRKLAGIYHTDREGGDPEAMRMVNAAADMLLRKIKG